MCLCNVLPPACLETLASALWSALSLWGHQSTPGLNKTPSCQFFKQETSGLLGPYICPLGLPWGPGQLVPRLEGPSPEGSGAGSTLFICMLVPGIAAAQTSTCTLPAIFPEYMSHIHQVSTATCSCSMRSFLSTLSTSTHTVMWFLYHAHAHSHLHNILAHTRTQPFPSLMSTSSVAVTLLPVFLFSP